MAAEVDLSGPVELLANGGEGAWCAAFLELGESDSEAFDEACRPRPDCELCGGD
jgi:hypothetical protein